MKLTVLPRRKRKWALYICLSISAVLLLFLAVKKTYIELHLLVKEIVDAQRVAHSIHLFPVGRISQDQEELLALLVKDPQLNEWLIKTIYKLSDGTVAERRAAAIMAVRLSRRNPNKQVVDLIDHYLAQRQIFETMVAAEMAVAMGTDQPILSAQSDIVHKRFELFDQALLDWSGHNDAITSTIFQARNLFTGDSGLAAN